MSFKTIITSSPFLGESKLDSFLRNVVNRDGSSSHANTKGKPLLGNDSLVDVGLKAAIPPIMAKISTKAQATWAGLKSNTRETMAAIGKAALVGGISLIAGYAFAQVA